jgi:hypothetical protein
VLSHQESFEDGEKETNKGIRSSRALAIQVPDDRYSALL